MAEETPGNDRSYTPASKFASRKWKRSLCEFLMQLASVILGIIITFGISGIINTRAQKREFVKIMKMVREEISDNVEILSHQIKALETDIRVYQYFNGNLDDIRSLPRDSVEKYAITHLSVDLAYSTYYALDVLKFSSAISSSNDNYIIKDVFKAYDAIKVSTELLEVYYQRKNKAAEGMTEEYRSAFGGFMKEGDIYDRLEFEYNTYGIKMLTRQSLPSDIAAYCREHIKSIEYILSELDNKYN